MLSLPFSLADRARPAAARRGVPAHRVTRGRLAGYGVAVGREVRSTTASTARRRRARCSTARSRRPALLCMSDELAIGALRAAAARGIAVPGELSVVGWDDTPEARAPIRR